MPTSSRGSRRDFAALEARRFQAAELFGRGESQAAVARVLGVTTAAANHWYQAWRAKGRRGLQAAGRAGRKPRLGPADLRKLDQALRAGPAAQGFATAVWTLPRVATVLERVTGVVHHPGHVWRVLRALGWSLQRPGRQARERDEGAIARWKSTRWPRLKKTPRDSGPGSSSKTRAASRNSRSPAHVGPARRDPDPGAHGRALEPPVGGGRPGLPLGWSAQPVLLPDPRRHLYRSRLGAVPARAQAALPGRAASSWSGTVWAGTRVAT